MDANEKRKFKSLRYLKIAALSSYKIQLMVFEITDSNETLPPSRNNKNDETRLKD